MPCNFCHWASLALDLSACYKHRTSTALNIPDLMTLDEFLRWDAPGPGLWQLIDGVPQAMAPAGSTHGVIKSNIASLIINHLDSNGSPCVMMTNPGIIPAFRTERNYFIPDAAVTCSEADINVPGIRHPILVIEILSPSNHAETWRNIRAYMLISSVREILVIRSDHSSIDLLRRDADGGWPNDVTTVTEGSFTLMSLELTLTLGALYRRSGVG
jgi:Uma2 family endonuclease